MEKRSVRQEPGEPGTKGTKKRAGIVRAAAKLFSEKGLSATTLNEIAASAGTQAGSLYYHFASRDELVREVLNISLTAIADRVQESWSALPPEASVIDRIRVGIDAHLHALLSEDPYSAAYDRIIHEVAPEIRAEFLEQPRAYGHVWRDLILEGQRAGELRSDLDASILRLLLLGSVSWSQLWFRSNGKMNISDVASALTAMFIEGVGSKAGNGASAPGALSTKPARARTSGKPAVKPKQAVTPKPARASTPGKPAVKPKPAVKRTTAAKKKPSKAN